MKVRKLAACVQADADLAEDNALIAQPIRGAFYRRVRRVLAHIARELSESQLRRAVEAPSDYLALLAALEEEPVHGLLVRDDPLAAARLRGLVAKRGLLERGGGVYTAAEVAELLGLTRQAVNGRRRSGRLLGLDRGRHGLAYPAWQLRDGRPLPGLEEVLAKLRGADPWEQLGFFLEPHDALDGETPLVALERGDLDPVLRAARALGEQGPM